KLSQRKGAEARRAYALPSLSEVSSRKSFRQRFSRLTSWLRAAALGLIVLGIADPQLGVRRQETITPSTDTELIIDVSGSMDEKFNGPSSPSKLVAAEDAMKAYINEQRRGTSNRVGLSTFSDEAYVDVHLTQDYDALIAHLKELHTLGSTAIGKAI